MIRTDVVSNTVPMLISRASMRKMLDGCDSNLNILAFGFPSRPLQTVVTASGHLAIPLTPAVHPIIRQSNVSSISASSTAATHFPPVRDIGDILFSTMHRRLQ